MVYKFITKHAMLMLGILIMVIFLFDLKKRGIFFQRKEAVTATSCKSVLVMLDKRVPATWTTKCEGNNLAVTIKSRQYGEKLTNQAEWKSSLYKELANSLIFISKNSLSESLERVMFVRLLLQAPKMDINAVTEGKFISKFATLEKQEFVLQHLKATVQVKESPK